MNKIIIYFVLTTTVGLTSTVSANTLSNQPVVKMTPDPWVGYTNFGNSIAAEGNLALIGANFADPDGEASGTAYLFDLSTGTQLTEFKRDSGASERDFFGAAVDIKAGKALIGAPRNPFNNGVPGSAYLFDVATGSQLLEFTASDGEGPDYFGDAVALYKNTALIGAPHDNSILGSVYLFDTNTGNEIGRLTGPGAYFGNSIDVQGDRAIIGSSSSASIFDLTTGTRIATLSSGARGFGFSVSIFEDKALVGARWDANNSGSAFLFDLSTGEQLFKFIPSDRGPGDIVGYSVSLNDKVAIVGSRLNDQHGPNAGAAYVFDIETGEQIAQLLPDDPTENHWFGSAVMLEGDTAIVGAPGSSAGGFQAGLAYVYTVPEPGSLPLLALSALGLKRRRRCA